MDYKVIPTYTFKAELGRTLDYIANTLKSVQAAKDLMRDVQKVRDILANNPELKAPSTKTTLGNMGLREWLVCNYVIVYRIEDGVVYLEHIFHQSQDYERLA